MAIGDNLLDLRDGVAVKLITNASAKKERVNAELEKNGVNVRIASFEVQMGAPPSVVFCVEDLPEKTE